MAETKEERRKRIEREVAEKSAARTKLYFENLEKAKAAAAAQAPALPASDAYNYNYAWKSTVGSTSGDVSGSLNLVKTQNPYYDASTNEIVNPATGERTPVTQSMWSGPTSFFGSSSGNIPTSTDKYAGLTPEQIEARKNAEKLAAELGLSIDPKTGMIIKPPAGFVIDPKTGKFVDPKTLSQPGKIETGRVTNADGSITITYSDGSKVTIPATVTVTGNGSSGSGSTVVNGNVVVDGNTVVDNSNITSAQSKSLSAFEVFRGFLNQYGLGALAADVEKYKLDGLSDDELLIRLRTESAAYKRRFAANEARVAKGLMALSEAAYIGLEDQYQDVMRRYGLPESYYIRGEMGRQEGFEKFISLDVSPIELEDRIQTAYNRVINANPEVGIALRNFYPGITNGDVLAYALDPTRALSEIQRKITAAEIGGAAVQSGLTTNESDAQYLARYGITKEQAQQGYRTISGYLPRASQLSEIYAKQGVGPYTQASAEREVFNVPGAAEEERKRLKISSLEQAAFSGQSGLTGGALGRERAGQF